VIVVIVIVVLVVVVGVYVHVYHHPESLLLRRHELSKIVEVSVESNCGPIVNVYAVFCQFLFACIYYDLLTIFTIFINTVQKL
jgi:hypothetical protein